MKWYTGTFISVKGPTLDVQFSVVKTNSSRKSHSFRTKTTNTIYALRFVKIPRVNRTTGETYEGLLLKNLSPVKFFWKGLKNLLIKMGKQDWSIR